MTGLTTAGLSSSSANGDTEFSGLRNLVDGEMRNGNADLTLAYEAFVVSGTADVQKLAVSNTTAGTFTADKTETVEVTTSLVNSALTNVVSDKLKTLKVSGDKNLNITGQVDFDGVATGTTITGTVDAAAFTGDLTFNAYDIGASDENLKITGGSGNDTFNLAGTLTVNDVIDGGEGTDTLSITGHDGSTALKLTDLKLTSIETFKVEATNDKVINVNADGSTVTKLVAVENATTAKAVTFNNLAAGVAVELIQSVDGQAMGAVGVTLKDASGTADALSIKVSGTSGQADEAVDSIAVANVETIDLESGYTGTTATVATDFNVITNQTYSAAKVMNITGNTNLTFTNAMTAANLKTINANAFTGALSLVAHAGDLTTTGGSGDDTFTMGTTLTAADQIDGGTGTNDTLTATINALGTSITPAALKIANVENVNFQATTAASFINAAGITGATTLAIGDANGAAGVAVTLSNLAAGQKIGLGGLATDKEFTGTVTASLADETGTADQITFVLADTDSDNDVNATLKTNAALEKVIIEASTDGTTNDATLNVTDLKSGTLALTKGNATEVVALGTLSTTTSTLDASAYDGLISATASATGTTVNIKKGAVGNTLAGGDGNDIFTFADLNADDANGGNGDNTLNATIQGDQTEATTNFKTINYTVGDGVDVDVDGADGKGVDTATTFKLLGGNALSSWTHDLVSPASLTSYDMSGFTGASTAVTVAADQLTDTIVVKGSAGTSDSLTAKFNTNNGSFKPAVTAVETLTLIADSGNTGGETYSFDLSATDASKLVLASSSTGNTTVNLTKVVNNQKIELDAFDNSSILNVTMNSATGTTDALTLILKDTDNATGIIDINAVGLEILNLEVAAAAENHQIDIGGVTATTGSKVTANVTGGQAGQSLTLNAIDSSVGTIEASSFAGNLIMSAGVASTAQTINTGNGDDTLFMANQSDALNAGAGTDNLKVAFNAVLGGIQVDLSSTTDQVTSLNGSANATVQKGFENVDLSAYAGSFGADITAISTGSTIIGTANGDQITGGAGVDIITGGVGADNIAAGASDTLIVTAAAHSNRAAFDTVSGLTNANVASVTLTLKDQGTEVGVTAGKLTATATDLSGAANEAAAINLLLTGDGGTNSIVKWGTYNGNTYIAQDLTDSTAADTDIAIKLTGALDLLSGDNLMVTFA